MVFQAAVMEQQKTVYQQLEEKFDFGIKMGTEVDSGNKIVHL